MSEWKTIESAPRDGTSVLLFTDDRGDNGLMQAYAGYWASEHGCWMTDNGENYESWKYGPHWWMPMPTGPLAYSPQKTQSQFATGYVD